MEKSGDHLIRTREIGIRRTLFTPSNLTSTYLSLQSFLSRTKLEFKLYSHKVPEKSYEMFAAVAVAKLVEHPLSRVPQRVATL